MDFQLSTYRISYHDFYGIVGVELVAICPPDLKSTAEPIYGIALGKIYQLQEDGGFQGVSHEDVGLGTSRYEDRRGKAHEIATFFLWRNWLQCRLERFERGLGRIETRVKIRRNDHPPELIKIAKQVLAAKRSELARIELHVTSRPSAKSVVARVRRLQLREHHARAAIRDGGDLCMVMARSDETALVARVSFGPSSPYGNWKLADAIVEGQAFLVSGGDTTEVRLDATDEEFVRKRLRRTGFYAWASQRELLSELEAGFSLTKSVAVSDYEACSNQAKIYAEISRLKDQLSNLRHRRAALNARACRRRSAALTARRRLGKLAEIAFKAITEPFSTADLGELMPFFEEEQEAVWIARMLDLLCSEIGQAEYLGKTRRSQLLALCLRAEDTVKKHPARELFLAVRRARKLITE